MLNFAIVVVTFLSRCSLILGGSKGERAKNLSVIIDSRFP